MNDPNFIASYNAGRALWLSQEPSERKTPKRPENFEFLAENEDPWSGVDASQAEQLSLLQRIVEGEDSNELKREELKLIKEQIKEIDESIAAHKKKKGIKGKKELDDSDPQTPKDIFYDAPEDNEDEMRKLYEILVETGWRKDPKTPAKRNAEKEAGVTLNRAFKGYNARKEVRQLKEKMKKELDIEIEKIIKENRSAKLLSRAVKGRNARKELRELKELSEVKQVQEEQAGKVITKAAQRYRANKERKTFEEAMDSNERFGWLQVSKGSIWRR
jgi:hypothetical protein